MRQNFKVVVAVIFWICATIVRSRTTQTGYSVTNNIGLSLSDRASLSSLDNQKRREDILNVVNNSLSSEGCKNVVLGQIGDGTQCLRDGCANLESYQNVISLVGCTDDDYNKLHDVICVSTDPPCTSPTPTIPGKTEDEKRRKDILNVVNNSLSSEGCKNVVLAQLGDGTQCLRDGCATLESYQSLVSIVGCSDDDYNKLHDVICVSTDPPCPSPTPIIPGKTEDEKRREDIRNVVNNNLSSEGCKNAVLGQLGDETECLRDGCSTLESYQSLVSIVGCSDDDYTKLHDVICVSTDPPCPSPTPIIPGKTEDEKRREDILNVANNSLSSEGCKSIVLAQLGDGTQCLRDGCATLEGYQNVINLVGCTDDDYIKLHDVICVSTDPPCPSPTPIIPGKTEDEKRREDILHVVNNSLSNEGCKNVVLAQLGDGTQCLRDGCATLESYQSLVSIVGCTDDDYNKLHNVICVSTDPSCATPTPTIPGKTEDEKRREDIKNVVNNNLSSEGCKNVVLGQLGDGTQCLRDGCATLESYQSLVSIVGCSDEDYSKLHDVICVSTDPSCATPTPTIPGKTEDEKRREDILNVVNYGLSKEECKNIMLAQLGDGYQCLRGLCATLENHKNVINLGGCTDDDYKKLYGVICVPTDPLCLAPSTETSRVVGEVTTTSAVIRVTTKDPSRIQEQIQKDQIRCTINTQMSSQRCRNVIAAQMSENDDISRGCTTLESYRDVITIVGCVQADYDKLYGVICTWDDVERCVESVTLTTPSIFTSASVPFESEREQRQRIQEVIINDVEEHCREFMLVEIGQPVSTSLEQICHSFLDNRGYIVLGGKCSTEDYEKLKSVICETSAKFSTSVNNVHELSGRNHRVHMDSRLQSDTEVNLNIRVGNQIEKKNSNPSFIDLLLSLKTHD